MFYAFVLGLVLQGNVILYYFFIARGIGMSLGFLEACIVMPILICIQLIPLTPGGIGVREFSYIYLLKPFGVTEAQAVAFSLWDYILTFSYGIIGGILYLLKKTPQTRRVRRYFVFFLRSRHNRKMYKEIIVRGARQHNLKNVDVDLPRNQLIVITGLSGSGKSSLAFDTIFGEGQRRYVESLSAYARQFLQMMEKPDVDSIEGLSPAISIEQKTITRNPRSTVATVTEVQDYLRLLYARIGTPYCPRCDLPIQSQTNDQIVEQIVAEEGNAEIQLLAPIIRERKGEYRKELEDFLKKGFSRARIDGSMTFLDQPIKLERHKFHTIELVVDRFPLRDVRARKDPQFRGICAKARKRGHRCTFGNERKAVLYQSRMWEMWI